MAFDPNDHTVREMRGEDSILDDIDSIEELEAARQLEEEGKDRKTAHAEIERRIEELEDDGEEEEDDPLEELYVEEEADEADEPEPASYPADNSTETVIFDPLGTPSNVPTGHDAIHLPDDEYKPRCEANVGAKGVRRRRNELPSGIAECDDCRTA